MAKKGLGKGLSAVFEEQSENDIQSPVIAEEKKQPEPKAQTSGVQIKVRLPEGIITDENGTLWVNPQLLKPNPRQPRKYFNEEDLEELTQSVRKEGVLSPVIIEDAGDGKFFIIAGERRTRASLRAGLEKIPVQIRKYTDERKLEVALIENIQRTDLNPVEEAQAYYNLMQMSNLTQDQVAERVGKRRSTVANCLRLLKLPNEIQDALIQGEITSGHARALLSLDTSTDMKTLYEKVVNDGLTVRQTEEAAKNIKIPKAPKKDHKKDTFTDPNFLKLEQKIIESLNTKVQIKGDFDKGVISISYFSQDDLNRIFSIIAPDAEL